MRTHFELQNTIIADITKMKGEIEEIKTHFATKADMIKWVVGVGISIVLAISGVVWNLWGLTNSMDARLTQDIRELRGMVAQLAQESKETRQAVAALSKKMDEQNHKQT